MASLEEYTFRCWTSLTNIYCYAETVPEIDINTFMEITLENIILHVPASALEAYKTTAIWSDFGSIVAFTEGKTDIQQPIVNVIYDLAGHRVEKIGKGIYIVNGKKL